jgi:hypothetical protein
LYVLKNMIIFKIYKLMSTQTEWSFDDETQNETQNETPNETPNETQIFFSAMLENFLPFTPWFILELFKKCVNFSAEKRFNFKEVS